MNCKHFGICGGCTYRNLEYKDELIKKQESIKEIFSSYDLPSEIDIIESPSRDYYRHKMEFSFGIWDDELKLGLHEKGLYYKTIDIDDCKMQDKYTNKILTIVRDWAKSNNIPAYHKKRRQGILRNLVIRSTKNIPGIMIILITNQYCRDARPGVLCDSRSLYKTDIDQLTQEFKNSIPTFKSFYLGVNSGKSDVAIGEETTLIYGDEYLEENIGDYKFKIGPYTFFQNNIKGIETLYGKALEWLGEGDTLIDLYSGVGTISIFMSKYFKKVIGVEVVEDSVNLANKNLKLNNITNINFIQQNVETGQWPVLGDSRSLLSLVVDPPRAGLGKKAINKIIEINPKKFVYISCNPKTMAEDLSNLTQYKILKIQAIDMFPHTKHLEMIALLEVVKSQI